MAEDKRIVISGYNAASFEQSKHSAEGKISLSQFCDSLLQKLFDGSVIMLEPENAIIISDCAKQLNRDSSYVVNSLLEKIDPVPLVKPEKILVHIWPQKQKVNVAKKNKINKIINY